LPALPEQLPLGLVARGAHLAGAGVATRFHDVGDLRVHADGEAIELDQERSSSVPWIATAEGVLDGGDRELIDHLDGGRDQASRDDRGDGCRGLLDAIEHAEDGLHRLRLLEDADADLGGHAERALGADEDPGQVVAEAIARLASEPRDLSAARRPRPESPSPARRATNAKPARLASRTIPHTCSADVGKTTKSASARKSVSPSDSYTSSSSGSLSTAPRPSIASSSRRSWSFW